MRVRLPALRDIPFWRPLLAGCLTLIGMGSLTLLHDRLESDEKCTESLQQCLADVLNPNNIEGSSILWVGILYLLERGERKKRNQYEAWQVIDGAAAAGVSTSPARFMALEDLNQDGVSLKGIELRGVDLEAIDLQRAQLTQAKLEQAILRKANLQGADLTAAKLNEADLSLGRLNEAVLDRTQLTNTRLEGAQLVKASLREANLTGACLLGSFLSRATLYGANLSEADLSGAELLNANFNGCDFREAKLIDANLVNAKFKNARNLTPEQVMEAKNWELAIYDDGLSEKLGLNSDLVAKTGKIGG